MHFSLWFLVSKFWISVILQKLIYASYFGLEFFALLLQLCVFAKILISEEILQFFADVYVNMVTKLLLVKNFYRFHFYKIVIFVFRIIWRTWAILYVLFRISVKNIAKSDILHILKQLSDVFALLKIILNYEARLIILLGNCFI